jgi:hypothetical protein
MVVAVYEGDTDLPVIEKLLQECELELAASIDCGGKSGLDAELDAYNDAARGSPYFVLRDLDNDAACAPEYLRGIGFAASAWMCFRIAMRELEAWLIADSDAIADFLHVSPSRVPGNPDELADPTETLVNLARRSTKPAIKKAMVPRPKAGVCVGPQYEAMMIEFGRYHWDPSRASARSDSLRRTRRSLRDLATRWHAHIAPNK